MWTTTIQQTLFIEPPHELPTSSYDDKKNEMSLKGALSLMIEMVRSE